jgi:hypothetical protein
MLVLSSPSQYKNKFKKWNMKKNVPKSTKAAIIEIHLTRANAGMPTTAKYKGVPVETKKLRRHLKETSRRHLETTASVNTTRADSRTAFVTTLPLSTTM